MDYRWYPPGRVGKLGALWAGPYPIIEIKSPWVVVIDDGRRKFAVSVRNLKPQVTIPEEAGGEAE